MSYWAATVITSILQRVPVVGDTLFRYVVGGFSVTKDTLVRVFSAHVCLAFFILGLVLMHLFYLHKGGSNNPLFAASGYGDVVLFHSYFTVKDSFSFFLLLFVFVSVMLCVPDFVLDVEGFIEADPLRTPVTIKPEWYFLAFYAMLRSVESKVGGLVLVLGFLFVLWLPTLKVSCAFSMCRQWLFWVLVSQFVLLTYLGACHPEIPFVSVRKCARGILLVSMILFKGLNSFLTRV